MIDDVPHIRRLSNSWNINEEDILLIALNACGLNNRSKIARMRLKVVVNSAPGRSFQLILSNNRPKSPFHVVGENLMLDGQKVATVSEPSDDNAVFGYFRRNYTSITLNSNARSHCVGCAFCPNTLEGSTDSPALSVPELIRGLDTMSLASQYVDYSKVVEVNLSTGCFRNEDSAIAHLVDVRSAMRSVGIDSAMLGILTSVIRSKRAFEHIRDNLGKLHLILTAECFTNRRQLLKSTKASLTPPEFGSVLTAARSSGHETDLTYIVGIDPIDTAVDGLAGLVPELTRFPNLQVYQPHNGLMDILATRQSKQIEYYLEFRQEMERLFSPTAMRPEGWENYRPLWYCTFSDESCSDAVA